MDPFKSLKFAFGILPTIKFLGHTQPPSGVAQPDRCVFPSPDGKWSIVYHSPRNWTHGEEGWKISVLYQDADVTAEHSNLIEVIGDGYTECLWEIPDFTPWCYDSENVAILVPTKRRVFLYNLRSRQIKPVEISDRPLMARWAPDQPRLLLTCSNYLVLVDSNARVLTVLQTEKRPYAAWLGSANMFLVVGRLARDKKTRISFFKGDRGTLSKAINLDPNHLVPYDRKRYASISRDKYTLAVSGHTKYQGYFLDNWHSIRYDARTGLLVLGIFRPEGAPYQDMYDGTLCRVRNFWYAAKVLV